jgi:hypothetical protein
LEQFHKDRQNNDGLSGRCIECKSHERRLARYDLTPQAYNTMGFLQNWECAICRSPLHTLYRGLVVDHDHATGKVRGLLCDPCNLALGHFADDVVRMQRGIEYLELWMEK